MPFPSTLSTFNRPTATDRLNSPSHSALHNTVSSALGQVEAVIGVEGPNSVVGTLEYFIKSPDSNGGGHIQTANKGGTGQTSYAKGDILVATSSSVLSKLAVSSTSGEVLVSDTTQSTGMKWGTNPNSNKLAVRSSFVSYSAGETSMAQIMFVASIAGSTLGTNNAFKFKGEIENLTIFHNATWRVNYGGNSIISIVTPITASVGGMMGTFEGVIQPLNNSSVAQEGYASFDLGRNVNEVQQIGNRLYGFGYGVSSVNSQSPQSLNVTVQLSGVNNSASISGRMFLVEKIS